jgi:Holliday junction resolvase RusA-like endonuclease
MINIMKKKRNTLDETPCIITVRGEPASKANSRRLVMMGGKPRFIKSKKALGYSSGFNTQVGCRKELIEDDVCIAIKIFYKSRRPDLDESLILDLLEDKVYKNDRQVKLKHIEWGLDKENPRAIIVVGPRDQKELVVDTLHQALKEES